MEIKVLIFIAFLVISVISSVVRGLRKFNESRPGTGGPVIKPQPQQNQRDPFRDLVKELEESFGNQEKEEEIPEPVFNEPQKFNEPEKKEPVYYTAETYERPAISLEKLKSAEKKKVSETKTGRTKYSHLNATVEDQKISQEFDLPESGNDLRKMIIWSAILNRPQY